MSTVDWQAFVFDGREGWTEKLMRVARRRFPDPVTAEAAYNTAFDKISAEGWAALQSFSGRSKPGTFLVSVFQRNLEDYSRSRYGRPRPPTWLVALGELPQRIFKMLCLERVPIQSIVDRLAVAGERAEREIRQMITTIKAKIPTCGEVRGEVAMAEPPEPASTFSGQGDPLRELMEEDMQHMLDFMARMLKTKPAGGAGNPLADESSGIRSRLVSAVRLDPEDRIILKQVFQDSRSVAAAARAMHIPEHQARRRLASTLKRLRKAFLDQGVDL